MVKNALTAAGAFAYCQPSHHCIHPLQPIVYYRLHSLILVGIRTRVRANRTYTQLRRYRIRQVQDSSCTSPACRQSAPFYLDSIEHMLLAL